ncbi:MYND-type domain-containing protein [Caerostris extrusa]|uniref:MYND-type domain-containing protein n=1 Tax=Caerostris extrusa TaxID=172846 RepID=A0AAV4PTL6_CAEEX|nr:MYND-type domain-containing protein [Caerostris extrusa]
MENYKLTSLTPDLAAHQVMNDMLERVSLFSERSVIDGPDITQMDALKVKELLMQFCHRYSLDYRDFEDISSVFETTPHKRQDGKKTPNGLPPSEKGPASLRGKSFEKVTRRVDRSRPRSRASDKPPVARRRYSTRSAKDVDDSRDSDVDIVIDSSTDRESEAGKEAEVRKKSQRLKKKQPVVEMPARERSAEKSKRNAKHNKREKPRTRSNDQKVEKPSSDESSKTILPKKKWTRLHHMNSKDRSPSVEIVDISKSESDLSNEAFKTEPLSSTTTTDKIRTRNKRYVLDSKRNISQKRFSSPTANKKLLTKSKCSKNVTLNDKANNTSSIEKDFSKRKKEKFK